MESNKMLCKKKKPHKIKKKDQKTEIGSKNKGIKQKTVANMIDINPVVSIITLNNSSLNAPIKRQRQSEWIKKGEVHVVYKETYFLFFSFIKLLILYWSIAS